jgi:hypothetical protein
METNGRVVKRENTAAQLKVVAITAAWFVLSSSAANVCAQNTGNDDRMIQSGSRLQVSGYETFASRPNPPAIFPGKNIRNSETGEAASNGRIIVNPVMEREKPASIQPIGSTPLAVEAGASVKIVTVTSDESPVPTHSTNVTLWDEIAPPVPSPMPADAATRSSPGDVASAGTQRTQ